MSTSQMLVETANRIFSDYCDKNLWDRAETGQFPDALWEAMDSNGFLGLGHADSGATLADLFFVLKEAGRHAVPLPLAEALLGNRWLGGEVERVSVGLFGESEVVTQIPWGRSMSRVLAIRPYQPTLYLMEKSRDKITTAVNMAGEPRDQLTANKFTTRNLSENPYELLALSRVMLMAGALERVLDLALAYAVEREQFGRPISKFQAIQHQLAVLAAEVAASIRAADAAVASLNSDRLILDLAAAKIRVGEAAGIAAEIAHQVHGAMGFTHEHQLHHFTRRLWAWRDEYGHEGYWQQVLGQRVAAVGADGLWPLVATRG